MQRDTEKKYVRSGRFQDEAQAVQIDQDMRALLTREGIKFTVLHADHRAILEFAGTLE